MVLEALAIFQQDAMQHLLKHRQEIIVDFSEDSYTIRIPDEDAPEGYWLSTLKFQDIDKLTFASCSCPDGECCVHLMTAYFAVYDSSGLRPLHYKFYHSFWYIIFSHFFLESISLQALGEMIYTLESSKISLEIMCLSEETFQEWLRIIHASEEPKISTKKTFSQATLYRIAKKFFFFNEEGAEVIVEENSQGFPSHFSLQWKGLVFKAEVLDFSTLETIFPKLEFAHTSLNNLSRDIDITNVTVLPDKAKVNFRLSPVVSKKDIADHPITKVGSIRYVSKLKAIVPSSQEIALSIYAIPLLNDKIKEHLLPLLCYDSLEYRLRYDIRLLRDASFMFSAYLTTPGDLDNGSLIYPNYCYSPTKGLIQISGMLLPKQSFIIKSEQVEGFLNEMGHLIQEPGFQVFINERPQGHLTYNVTEQGVLLFHYDVGDPTCIEIRFGTWTYYTQQGFFLQKKNDLPIQDGLIVEPKDVAGFIITNDAALRRVPGFFSACPNLKDLLMEVHKEAHGKGLELKPIFVGIEESHCRLFGVFLYRESIGFSLIPSPLQGLCSLPRTIPPEHVPQFLTQYAQHDRIVFSDPETCPPQNYELIIKSIQRPHPASPLHLQLELKTDLGSIPIGVALQGLKSKLSYLFTKAGFLDLKQNLFQFLQQFLSTQKCVLTENIVIATITDIFKLDALAPLSITEDTVASPEDLLFFSQLKAACLPPIPQNLFSSDHKLRPYQNSGLLWLWFLYNHRLSGLLCDEMGLGKTHQATALLDIVFQSSQESARPKFLIVCPTSVLPHWEHILSNHLPGVSIFAFHGPNKPNSLPPADILITSYGTLRQNYDKFYKIAFTIVVFDEIHMAKNKSSQIHKILCRIDAQMKLGLTGTPIENNLLEFKGLLDIILPNYLPSDALFKKLFTKRCSSEELEEIIPSQDLLLKLTRPFILRRTKKLVLPELPDKVESIISCSLSPDQEKLYVATLKREKGHIQQLEVLEEPNTNFLHIFALLNHLKQICDHPAVFFKDPDQYKNYESGKWNAFTKLLKESLNSGYKVVVFSQYIHMIRIITLYLEEIGVKYASIQGKSLNRKEAIETFTTDPECQVFVGSLLAAGTGINLTAGNVVIMYDRWWNPAKENQALDRVHRIGQKNTVFIYKLITEDTLEERIHYLIEKKIRLLDKVIASQDSNILHMLNREDLITILSYKDERGISDSEGAPLDDETSIQLPPDEP
ncbi:ATP-dependent helicase HepA,N-formylmethionyl-tRNA deformylase,SNF2 family N-terminal domain [Chlamydia serpentis]|uniref:ATP-dependent helicase HepA,N-formylmethionyl-tRNA deformylase,SNF2 family N-terminal domain n=1 Tax=Chlamydia serpentis TaxID=1967782 RepID=A0A2R8FC19_9CHLA|nr:DEAD/DEAH box helicase [Chlamydia serpentis]SPN73948.1 ATP-dependent helicase HepA,N-formylmethionyl-tRNA deformylase,SNF2 family N-terminal domain [Chlamydia serpentis]